MDALWEAWDNGWLGLLALKAGEKERARVYLANATGPAARAFPDDNGASFGLTRALGLLLEEAAA